MIHSWVLLFSTTTPWWQRVADPTMASNSLPFMKLSEDAIKDFIKIYQLRYGVLLSFEEAEIEGLRLIELFAIIAKKIAH